MHAAIEKELQQCATYYRAKHPVSLYEPVAYMIELGGKRVRPLLVVMGNYLAGGDYNRCLSLAAGLELFHNFTLVHDDVMDAAPLRRGKVTVHKRYGLNTAILSGDVMFTEAINCVLKGAHETAAQILPLFLKTAAEVCEGQQLDMDFEQGINVTLQQYMQMIEYKTAVLLAASLKMGALSGGANDELASDLYALGSAAGLAFQLQDDWLDAFGNPSATGKQPGGDILANKKTWLMISLLVRCSESHRIQIEDLLKETNPDKKLKGILSFFEEYELREGLQQEVQRRKNEAFGLLESLDADANAKEVLRTFLYMLAGRKS